MPTLTFNLRNQVRDTQASAVGIEQYNGGEVLETQGNRLVAVFMTLSETVSKPTAVTDAHNLNTAMFDMTLFFVSAQGQHGHGGGGGGGAPGAIRVVSATDITRTNVSPPPVLLR